MDDCERGVGASSANEVSSLVMRGVKEFVDRSDTLINLHAYWLPIHCLKHKRLSHKQTEQARAFLPPRSGIVAGSFSSSESVVRLKIIISSLVELIATEFCCVTYVRTDCTASYRYTPMFCFALHLPNGRYQESHNPPKSRWRLPKAHVYLPPSSGSKPDVSHEILLSLGDTADIMQRTVPGDGIEKDTQTRETQKVTQAQNSPVSKWRRGVLR